MSTWTEAEVDELLDQNGGGNLACQHIWLAKAPIYGGRYSGGSGSGSRPKQGDRVEIFKQFVVDAYEYQLFKADTPYVPTTINNSSTNSAPSSLNSSATVTPTTSGKHSPQPQPPRQQQQHQQQVVASLLSMDEDPFTATVVPPSSSSSATAAAVAPSTSLSTSAFSMSYSDSNKVRAFEDFGIQPPQKIVADPFGYPVAAAPVAPAATVPIAPAPFRATTAAATVPIAPVSSRATSASVTPPPPPQVDLLSYDDFSAPVSTTSRPAGTANDTNWLDLLAAPVSAPTTTSMRSSAMIGAPIGAAVPTATIPPVMKAQAVDPFGSISLLQPANAGPAYPVNPGSAMSRGIPSSAPGAVPMTGMMGYNNNRMQSTSPMMMTPSVGPSLTTGAFPSSTTPPMRPSPMMGAPMMNGGRSAISALDSSAPGTSYRPSQPARPAQDSFGFLQDTMRQQLENSR
eukprot:scaffold2028_cov181-Ochromonas_danica.AAC.27